MIVTLLGLCLVLQNCKLFSAAAFVVAVIVVARIESYVASKTLPPCTNFEPVGPMPHI